MTPVLLIPGLGASARLYGPQIPALWRHGPVTVANHTRGETMAAIAGAILRDAPPRFALAGLSMGGYLAFEILRQAPERVDRLALLDTSAWPDTPEQTENRRRQIAVAEAGRIGEVFDQSFPMLVHPAHREDAALRATMRAMAAEAGTEAFIRQQKAIRARPDSRPDLAHIACPTLILVGDEDALTPPERAREMAAAISGATLAVIPGAGHISTLEQPEAVTASLLDWLAR